MKSVDVSNSLELLNLAREVQRTGEPRILMCGDQEIAVLAPSSESVVGRRRPPRRRAVASVPAWVQAIVDVGRTDGPTDVSRNKHKYLAEAYDLRRS